METQEKQEPRPTTDTAPAATATEQPSQSTPAASTTTRRQRIFAAMRHPAVPAAAVALLAIGCIAAFFATGSSTPPAADEAAVQKKKGKASGKDSPNLRIPRWMSENEAFPSTGKSGGDQPATAPKTPAPTPAPPPPPEPPRFLSNPSVPDDISWNHPHAVSDTTIASRGWASLSDGQRTWVIRRTRAKALAYRSALLSAHQKFIARIWPADIAANGQRQFLAIDANLRAAVAAADGRLAASYEAVDAAIGTAKAFVEEANATWLEADPVTLPNFEEKLNPAWQAWQSRYGRSSGSR